jgi:hypothetical protein
MRHDLRPVKIISGLIRPVLFCLLGAFCLMAPAAQAGEPQASPAKDFSLAPPAGFRELGGSNYCMIKVGQTYREKGLDHWFTPGMLHPVIGMLHQHPKQEILDQLKTMHDGGQRKIALVLWYDHITTEPLTEGCWGHTVRSNGGALLPQHQTNLRNLLKMLRETKYFDELNFRMVGQGPSDAAQWNAWDEAMYQENWNFLISTRRIVLEELKGSPIKILFDLGLENGGQDGGQMREYMKRLWKDYCTQFGKADCFGFSFALSPGRLARQIQIYDEVGIRPDLYAFDVYSRIYEKLQAAAFEFKAAGIEHPRIIIQETYYSDPQALEEIQRARKDFNLDILYLMQWPLERGRTVPHFSMDYPAGYAAYVVQQGPGEQKVSAAR